MNALRIPLIVAIVALAACADNPANPTTKPQDVIAVACAPSDQYVIERCAEAVGDVYAVFQRRALEVVSDPALPGDVKRTIQSLDRELTPAVRVLVQTADAYVLLREASDPEAGAKRAELAVQLMTVKPKVQTLPQL
jgi:hypothetical protein